MTTRESGSAYRSRTASFVPPEEPDTRYRSLTTEEIAALEQGGSTAADWSLIQVAEGFRPEFVQRCRLEGRVNLGCFKDLVLSAGGLELPAGLYECRVVSSTIAGNSAVHRVAFISQCYIDREALLFRIHSLSSSHAPSFGLGTPRAEEPVTIETVNENGRRPVRLHPGAVTADCSIQLRAAGDPELQRRLDEYTASAATSAPGKAGSPETAAMSTIGPGAAVISAGILSNVRIGPAALLEGPALLEDVTVRSSDELPAVIGSGVQLQRGVVGFGAEVSSGAIAADFFIADGAAAELGVRLLHTVLGENSSVGCAEIQHAFIDPFHAQHHNNSFLIAARLRGQSNIAAGATIGSNHNSRAADGEILAGRGFWPALCSSVKHNSFFASYTLLAKAAYPAEMNVSLPFSLVSRDEQEGRLVIMPGYWFMYNMYALARNSAKYAGRDHRPADALRIETDFLAPDTAEELLRGISLLEEWIGPEGLAAGNEEHLLPAGTVERSRQRPKILKASAGYRWYRRMLHLYGITALADWAESTEVSMGTPPPGAEAAGTGPWQNIGGLLVPQEEWNRLRADIIAGTLASWNDIHERCAELSRRYQELKAAHGYRCLMRLHGLEETSEHTAPWPDWTAEAAETVRRLADAAEESRRKDFKDPFRRITFTSDAEARAVYGEPREEAFTAAYRQRCSELAGRLEALSG